MSGDALWVPKYNKDGLTESFDLSSLPVSKQLYSIARDFPFWKDGSNYMGYPFSWSTVQIYYNPKYVKTKPGLVARAARPEVQGEDLAREHPDGHDGDRRQGDRREEAVQHDDGRDRGRRRT